ncbi:MAG: LPS-assembly protein LptD [Allorhizobium sp.]
MAAIDRKNIRRPLAAILTTALLCLSPAAAANVRAEDDPTFGALAGDIPEDAKLLLAANEMIYNRDAELITAIGGVQINYNGYQMVARRVEYNQKTGRLMATGDIEMIQPDGNRLYADSLDVTDDFADGFLQAMRIETSDNTRFAAESGERVAGRDIILHKGVYTACLPCADHPERPPLWQIKAERVIQNGEKHTVRLEKARFEIFGQPIAYVPAITMPDHTVKRKSGFLFPTMSYSQHLGFGIGVPYYWAISNHMDATFKPTYFTGQGVLMDIEVRKRFESGETTLRFAGIDQTNPGVFAAGSSDAKETTRFLAASTGKFEINPRWTFGWDVMRESDNNFATTYSLGPFSDNPHINQVYLTGQGERNFFDMRGYYFDVQDSDVNSTAEKKQAVVLPILDYSYTAPDPVYGGELTADLNFTSLTRSNEDTITVGKSTRYRGLNGSMSRLTGEAEWKRTYATDSGLLLTPLLAARGDAFGIDMDAPTGYTGGYSDSATATRYMATAGLEARYPVLMTTDSSSHVFEPIAQLYVRPDEQLAGQLPNEDAQSFVFDATSLFDRDKFSGFDRVEGGTRANIGVRYTGTFDNGFGVRGIAGQSYQIAGLNSFATDDLVKVGADSGLETARSDYVAMIGLDTPFGVALNGNVRLDEKTLDVRQTSATATFTNTRLTTSLTYLQLEAQPDYGFTTASSEIQATNTLRLNNNWSLTGAATWDVNNKYFATHSFGVTYADECTTLALTYSNSRDLANTTANDWTVGAVLTFRTLGDLKVGTNDLDSLSKTN